MKLGKSVGVILRETRESNKMSVKDVARETNIIPRYIEALEQDDWGVFPGEPYALGFMRNYAEYLKLDPEELASVYEGEKINEMQTPLEELIKTTEPALFEGFRNYILIAIAVLALGVGVYFLIKSDIITKLTFDDTPAPVKSDLSQYRIQSHQFDQGDTTYLFFSEKEGRSINLQNQEINLLFMKVLRPEGGDTASANKIRLGINFYPEKEIEVVDLVVNEPRKISFEESRFSRLKREFTLKLQSVKFTSARIMVTRGKVREGVVDTQGETIASNPNNVQLSIIFKFTGDSWCKFIVDDQSTTSGKVEAGEVKSFSASHQLKAHIGNAGGVQYSLNGKTYKTMGKKGQAVTRTFIKVPDPFDPSKFTIKEKGE